MANPTDQTDQKIETLKAKWYVWLFPIIAALICAWLLVDYFRQKGPSIQIYFEDASSIQAGKTKVRYRGVTIGMVKGIEISKDNKDVIADVQLQSTAEKFAVEGSKFWMVLPKVNLQEVSGLETLFEGTYINVTPGPADGKVKLEFKGSRDGETSEVIEETSSYLLETDNVGSVGVGDSITFRGLKIGSVSKVLLSKSAQTVLLHVNIENKFVRLIRTNTLFWRKMGIQANLGLFKSEIKINSLDSLLHGGIEIATPSGGADIAKAQTRFPLLSAPPKDFEKWNPSLE